MAKAKGKVEILLEYCKGCGLCVAVCPTGNLKISDVLSAMGINPATPVEERECTLCRRCTLICPDSAIRLLRLADDEAAADQREAAVSIPCEGDDA